MGCPPTCLNPDGNYDCGLLLPNEGCFCKPGFVRNSNYTCIELKDCPVITTQSPTTTTTTSLINW